MQKRYATLGKGYFVKLKCIPNVELEQLLMSMMDQVVVLSPSSLKSSIRDKVSNLKNYYEDV